MAQFSPMQCSAPCPTQTHTTATVASQLLHGVSQQDHVLTTKGSRQDRWWCLLQLQLLRLGLQCLDSGGADAAGHLVGGQENVLTSTDSSTSGQHRQTRAGWRSCSDRR